jgi:hypothetical protein
MRIKRRHYGQSLVEFAIIFPIIFFLITGFLDLGRAVFYYSSLTNAVSEATRYAIVHKTDINNAFITPTNNSLQDKVMEYAFGMKLNRADIIVTIPIKVNNIFKTVSIEATYLFKPITPGIKALFGSSAGISIKAYSKMRISPGSW